MREGYVLLLQEDQPIIKPRRSWWRLWNQLSRLQRNLISSMAIFILIVILYQFGWNSEPENEFLNNNSISKSSFMVSEKELQSSSVKEHHTYSVKETIQEEAIQPPVLNIPQPAVVEPKTNSNRTNFNGPYTERQQAVIKAFKHAWRGYKKWAWGHDHLKPLSRKPHDWFKLGLSIVDSLDTMFLMGLDDELKEARTWIDVGLNFNELIDVNLFEVTIRVLGGLLAAYHLTGDPLYKIKAKDLGERLLPCFTRSPSAIPYSDVNLASHTAHSPRWGPDSSTSEVTTIQLEFRDLSRITDDPKFEEAASRVSEHVHTLEKHDGLVPVFINPRTGLFQSYADIKLGARGDSYYEYLLKQWLQTGKTISFLRDDYLEAVNGIQKHLVKRTPNRKLLFIGELKGGSKEFVPKMDHLVCYLPGTLALGYSNGMPESHMTLAMDLLYTCYMTYAERPTFLAPEITYFSMQEDNRGDMYVKSNDAHNLLRPEFIESLWYIYQITGNKTVQDWGWKIFQSFEKYAKVEDGYTSLGNVNNPDDTKPRDMMESFFLSETLKYFFLLFSDNRKYLDLTKYVVNSEGHPMPVYAH